MDSYKELSYDKEKFKRKLLTTFSFTIEFLNRHNLRWFVGGGTCIGTIRHKGLIPWDDDIDIFIPRDDYDRLLSLQAELDGTNYELISWNKSYVPDPFAKVVDKSTTLWEYKCQPFVIGVFIDIFPMDISDKDPKLLEKQIRQYDRCLTLYKSSISNYSFKDLLHLLWHKHLRFFTRGVLYFFTHYRKEYYYKKVKALDKEHNCKKGEYLVLFSACFAYKYRKEIFKKEWFDDYILMPFEGIEVRMPIGYDAYLTHVYGDYMQMPSEKDRITRHFHYYMNLEERKTIAEIREIKRSME